ncbi:MAG TPA: DNA primase small subunit domain-containing protein [Conexivisphaerales archaeon]|nr:DNA primase small subunit domain-containing protein [Conexivisphaerales archaeon]
MSAQGGEEGRGGNGRNEAHDPALEFLSKAFRSYYFRHVESVEIPEDMRRREFGYLNFEGAMVRHLTFPNEGEFKAMMVREAPRSAYCSVAYYDSPGLAMEEKGYRKADLAFDIDSGDLNLPCTEKHDFYICGSCGEPFRIKADKCPRCGSSDVAAVHFACDRCLGAAKEEAVKLVDFLELDFGVGPGQTAVYFSGNRGFHVSVVGSKYETVDQRGRAEMVEYVEGKGFGLKQVGLLPRRTAEELAPKLPLVGERGWRGRVASVVYGVEGLGSQEALARAFVEQPDRIGSLVTKAIEEAGVKLDEGVTIDTHRVFRMGGTLHDKSGLLKKRYASLDGANPLDDAVAFGGEPVRVNVKYSPEFRLLGTSFGPYEKESLELPMYAAVYLAAKGLAVPGRGK